MWRVTQQAKEASVTMYGCLRISSVCLFVCSARALAMRMRRHFKVSGKPPFFGGMLTLTQIALRNCL